MIVSNELCSLGLLNSHRVPMNQPPFYISSSSNLLHHPNHHFRLPPSTTTMTNDTGPDPAYRFLRLEIASTLLIPHSPTPLPTSPHGTSQSRPQQRPTHTKHAYVLATKTKKKKKRLGPASPGHSPETRAAAYPFRTPPAPLTHRTQTPGTTTPLRNPSTRLL